MGKIIAEEGSHAISAKGVDHAREKTYEALYCNSELKMQMPASSAPCGCIVHRLPIAKCAEHADA